jgi:hypothetical protein
MPSFMQKLLRFTGQCKYKARKLAVESTISVQKTACNPSFQFITNKENNETLPRYLKFILTNLESPPKSL